MAENNNKKLIGRPPVIAIMGHIDHGKSTLLDYIRKSNIVDKEAGGITQHISAYEVQHKTSTGGTKRITFLDTPGHEAFSRMRERGAQIADIAVLIVSAEEGVKAQTIEAYKSIQESKTPFILAINKIDRPNANIEKVKQEVADIGIYVESYGGTVPAVPISAKTGQGVPELLDMMLLVAEMEDLKGDQTENGEGYILEANLDPKIGVTATLIIKNGTVETGDYVVAGKESAKIKKIENFLGQSVPGATFSSPVRVYGFAKIPEVGAKFKSFNAKEQAEECLRENCTKYHEEVTTGQPAAALGQIEIPLVVKTDVLGTLEALVKEINKLNTDKIRLNVIQMGVGTISESDIKLAGTSSNAIVIGFHVKTDKSAVDLADRFGIKISTFDIIYKMSEWLEEEVKTRTPKEQAEEVVGRAKVLKVFSQTKDKQIVGAQVTKGIIIKGKEVKILRHDVEIGRGKIIDLQEQKIKASQVTEGTQFGAEIESKLAITAGDLIEAFEITLK